MSSYHLSLDFKLTTRFYTPLQSILFTEYLFAGGAHGNYRRTAQVFDPKTGQTFTDLSAFFKADGLAPLKKIVEDTLVAQNVDPEFGWIDIKESWNQMSDIRNFYVSDKGVVIFFDPYEVDSFAAGFVNVTLSWWQIEELIGLKANSPLKPRSL